MVYLNIEGKGFDKHKKYAEENSIENCGEEDGKNSFQFDDLDLTYDEIPSYNENNNSINLGGTLKFGDDEIGYISLDVPLNTEIVIPIIEAYRKKLGKLKTVLEATR